MQRATIFVAAVMGLLMTQTAFAQVRQSQPYYGQDAGNSCSRNSRITSAMISPRWAHWLFTLL